MFLVWLLILLAVSLSVIYLIVRDQREEYEEQARKAEELKKAAQDREDMMKQEWKEALMRKGYNPANMVFCTKGEVAYIMAIDEQRKCLLLQLPDFETWIATSFADIIDVEKVIENYTSGHTVTTKSGGLGRAVAGGIIAGGAGAVVGASTAKTVGQTYSSTNSYTVGVIIYTKQLYNPTVEISATSEFNDRVYATVLAIISSS